MKLLLKIALSIFILFIVISGGGIFFPTRGLEAGEVLNINDVNLTELSDGNYSGAYKGGRWTNEVNVTVKGHKITDVEVVKDVLFPKPEVTAELIGKVLNKQTAEVDAIAGSTVTCKAYLKSIEIALENRR